MKKIIYLLLAFVVISCGSTSSSTGTGEAAKAEKPSKKTLKGTWEVTNIRFVGDKGLYKAFLFDVADSKCFMGSKWVFISNNNTGKFTLPGGSQCEAGTNRIVWDFYDTNDGKYSFQFKFVDEKNKPLDAANRGYRSNIDELTPTTMVTRTATTYEGNPFDVIMTYTKVSEDITL